MKNLTPSDNPAARLIVGWIMFREWDEDVAGEVREKIEKESKEVRVNG